jgi:hypothetical protein
MRLVVVESPFKYRHEDAHSRAVGLLRHITYARLAFRDCFLRGELPFGSHLLYTQPLILDDDTPAERALGIQAGFEWASRADASIFYTDLGVSLGMGLGYAAAEKAGRPYESRSLEGWQDALLEEPSETLTRLGLYDPGTLAAMLDSGGAVGAFGPVPHQDAFGKAPGASPSLRG